MEQNRAYYKDAYRVDFRSAVKSCQKAENGWNVILEDTCFYPEGGGQPWDLGTLGDSRVLAVTEDGAGVVHLCDRPLSGTVEGHIDFRRRFDFMQQHCGEHILCGIIHEKYGYHNVGFHLGADTVTMDVDGPLTREQLAEAEARANEAVWQNLPVKAWFPTEEELPHCVYRTKKPLPYPVRLVEIPGFDICACCGLHVARTGELGLIKILSAVGFKGGTRIELVCGKRAYAYVAAAMEQAGEVSGILSAKPLEIGQAARELQARLEAEKYRVTGLQKKLYAQIAADYAGCALAVRQEQGLEEAELRELCGAMANVAGIAAVCNRQGGTCTVLLMSRQEDVRPLGQSLKDTFSGKGGGKADCFRVSVAAADEEISRCLNM